jgi:ubiquinone/menaquinone biosynthesis C-methylase UbiE
MTKSPSDHLRETYERRAELQYAKPADRPDPRVDRKYARMTKLVASTLPASSLLDAGCGDGRFLAAIAREPNAPRRLVGSDISERILQTAAETVAREQRTGEFVQANLERLPFEDAAFERVMSIQVIEHLLDPAAGVCELARVLAPGGVLVLSTDNSKNHVSRVLNVPRTTVVRLLGLTGRRASVSFPHASFTQAQVASLIEQAGLTIEHTESFRIHLDGLNAPRVQRALNLFESLLPAGSWGDIIAFVARKT